jgi:trimethylguanosine synthase
LFDRGVQTDAEGLYSVTPEAVGLATARLVDGARVLDGFAGIGGSAIAFARTGKSVIAVDNNRDRLKMAEHNATIYGVNEAITFVHGDFFDVAGALEADTVNLDPPWGGPDYKRLDRFRLADFQPDGRELLRFVLPRFKQVLLRVPLNFDVSELTEFGHDYEVYDDLSRGRAISRTVVFR